MCACVCVCVCVCEREREREREDVSAQRGIACRMRMGVRSEEDEHGQSACVIRVSVHKEPACKEGEREQ